MGALTVEALARAKRLDPGFLRNLGVEDAPSRGGVLDVIERT